MKRYLVLEDGFYLEGQSIGSPTVTTGQLVISQNLFGLEETLTDPNYSGQIIAFSRPYFGGNGLDPDSYESLELHCKGVIFNYISNYEPDNSNSRNNNISINEFLKANNIPGIKEIDIRALSKHIRKHGALKASITDAYDEHAVDQTKALVLQRDAVRQVSTRQPYPNPNDGKKIVLIDLGLKYSILNELSLRDCNTIIVPYNYSSEQIRNINPDGIIISNGPGKPEQLKETIQIVKDLQEDFPILGIGLGHLLIGLANDCEIENLGMGHHSTSIPVKEIVSGNIIHTSHNHSYAIKRSSIRKTNFIITHSSTVDNVVEGMRHVYNPTFSVQFEPESSPGSDDGRYIFDEFLDMINSYTRL